MIKDKSGVSMGTAALITGLTLFVPTAPYAEFYVFGRLIVHEDAVKTTQNLLSHPKLFLSGIYAVFFTFMMDVVLAWTMYIFMRPVNPMLALLGAWLRIVYAGLAMVALFNYLYAYHLVQMPAPPADLNEQVGQLVNARRFAMHLAYLVFGSYLILGGVLIYKASYIPKVIGVLIGLAGLSWILTNLKPYFFPHYNLSWLLIFSVGEVVFAVWLLVKGRKIKESELVAS